MIIVSYVIDVGIIRKKSNMNYKRVNKYLRKFSQVVDGDYFKNIHKLMDYVLENSSVIPDDCPSDGVFSSIDINDSVEIVADFFRTINPMYEQMFRNMVRELSTTFISREQLVRMKEDYMEVSSGVEIMDDTIYTCICYDNTIRDCYMLVHEFCHRFSLTKNDVELKLIQGVFAEVDAITLELLLQDYLYDKYGSSMKANFKLYYRLINIKGNCQNYVEYYQGDNVVISHTYIMEDLLDLYKENGKLDEQIFMKYYNSLEDNSNAYFSWDSYDRDDIFEYLSKGFLPYGSAHFVGALLAFYIYQEIKKNPDNIKMFTTMFEVLGYADFEQEKALAKLEQVGIPIVKTGKIVIDEDAMGKLIEAYQKELNDIDFSVKKSL